MNDESQEMLKFKLDNRELFSDFHKHLGISNNKRIVFSGKFGLGKTYFLNEFFMNNEEKYDCYHLYPVNYQISSNQDVIEFLKYDLLIELLKKNPGCFSSEDFFNFIDIQRLLYLWGQDNIGEIIKTGLSHIPKLGRSIKDTAELTEKFLEFKKTIESGEKGVIENFIKKLKAKKIDETDLVSELIREKVSVQKGDKKSVLILDDLDRMDPDHIFRILNIFSAHFDERNRELGNKFGFDHILIVADANNLKSIFHHKYGLDTDFNGYFDKFFSVSVFEFDNFELINKLMGKIINHYQAGGEKINKALQDSGFIKLMLEDLFMFSAKLPGKYKLNLRQLLKGIKFPISSLEAENFKDTFVSNRDSTVPQYVKINLLTLMIVWGEDKYALIDRFKYMRENFDGSNDKYRKRLYEMYSLHILKVVSDFKIKKNQNINFIEWGNYQIRITEDASKIVGIVDKSATNELPVWELYFDLLIEFLKMNFHKHLEIEY